MIAKRNEEIVRRHFEDELSIRECAREFGVSEDTIKAVIREAKRRDPTLVSPNGGRTQRRFSDQPQISKVHGRIGAKLNYHREFSLKASPTEMAAEVRVGRTVLRKMELGIHDYTLSELMKISQVLSIPLSELVTDGNA